MKPIAFPQQNTVFAKDQPEYLPLPAHVAHPVTTTCWHLSWRERMTVLVRGRLWLQQMNFSQPLQPQRPDVECPL